MPEGGDSGNENPNLTEKEFITIIHNNEFYDEYREHFLSKDFEILTEIKDENKRPVGRMARIELDYNNTNTEFVNLTSYLVFSYEYEENQLNVFLVDNSQLYSNKSIIVNDLLLNTSETIDVSDEEVFQEFFNEVDNQLEEALETYASDNETNLNSLICFQCTKYENSSNDLSTSCMSAFSWVCGAVGKVTNLPGFLVCGGIALLSCWIPAYKICVDGKWFTNCPTP